MGWMWKEGMFKRICEQSMSILRKNSHYLLTILKVFLNDPLTLDKFERKRKLSIKVSENKNENNKKIIENIILTCQKKNRMR